VEKTPPPLPELRRQWRAQALARFGTELVDGLLAMCRCAAAAIGAAWNTRAPADSGAAAAVVDMDLAAVTVYIHHGQFRRRHLLTEARRHLARELHGRRAEADLESWIVTGAIRAHCVDASPPRVTGRRRGPPTTSSAPLSGTRLRRSVRRACRAGRTR
jgi:hypothetical protein